MLRRFTKDVGRWKAGVLHDWPLSTWNQLAKDAKFKSLDEFSKPEEISEVLSVRNRQNEKTRVRASSRQAASAG